MPDLRMVHLYIWVGGLGALFFLFAGAASAQQITCGQDTKIQPAEVREVASGVFVRQGIHALMTGGNQGAIANIGFVVGQNAVAVIDTGGSACDGARLKAAIAARTNLPIRYVINTHVHPDHIFGNAAFLADKPEFVGHHRLPRAMAMRGEHYLRANRERMGAILKTTKIVPPGKTVSDRLLLDLGGRKLVLTAHKTAHTDNDLSVFDETTGTLWTGDLLFIEHIPVVDGSLTGWLRVLGKLERRQVERVVPGHGPVVENWSEGLARQRRYLERLASDLRKYIKEGRTMSFAAATAAQSEKPNWTLFDDYNSRNATAGFAELEWE